MTRITRLLDGVTALGNGGTDGIQNMSPAEYGIFQVEITGTATVQLRGRTSPDMPWVIIDSLTASDGNRCTLFPYMDALVSSYGSGTITAELVI